MQPLRHYPQPERPSNPTPLEMAIYNYELKAKAFYDKKIRLGDSNKSELIKQLNQDYNHLKQERKKLSYIVVAQQSLEQYREYNEAMSTSVTTLLNESHRRAGKKLGRYLAASGEPRPTVNHEAHHIIPGMGSRAMQGLLKIARLNLHFHGIGINDPINGIWLYGVKNGKELDWATSDAVSHRLIHRYNYDAWIAATFRTKGNKETFLRLLNQVKVQIKSGTMPQTVMMKKNTNWDGK